MNRPLPQLFFAALLATAALPVSANEIEGRVEAIDLASGTVVVLGILSQVHAGTRFDDDLRGFGDLRVGQKVEVEFDYQDGWHFAKEIELEDD